MTKKYKSGGSSVPQTSKFLVKYGNHAYYYETVIQLSNAIKTLNEYSSPDGYELFRKLDDVWEAYSASECIRDAAASRRRAE